MNHLYPVTFDRKFLSLYREELEWTNQEIEMLAITLERYPERMSNVEKLRDIIQESLLSAQKLDLDPISESLADTLKGIDLLLDWNTYPVRMTEFVLTLFDRVMAIAREVEETHYIDMRKTQEILVALQSIILAKDAAQIEQGIENALRSLQQDNSANAASNTASVEIELFDDDDTSETEKDTELSSNSKIELFVPNEIYNPLCRAREFIKAHEYVGSMLILNNIMDSEVQQTRAHTRFMLELVLAINFNAGQYFHSLSLLDGICLHDLSIASSPELLLKDKLTEEEAEELRTHPIRSAEMARHMCESEEVELLISHHHERMDGSGYPYGLKNNEISEQGKLAVIVDTFHTVMDKHVHLSPKKRILRAIAEINIYAGKRYDPSWVREFNETMRKCWLEDWNRAVLAAA